MTEKEKDMDQEKLLVRMYSRGSNVQEEQFIESILDFLSHAKQPGQSLELIMREASKLITLFSQFREVAIGAKGKDGTYRYVALTGYGSEAQAARKEVVFTLEDMRDTITYRPIRICRNSQFYLAERKPCKSGMENCYNRPNLLGRPRNHPDDMVEGDFIEIPIEGKDRELIGWIEVSGTVLGKLPKCETILQLEFFTSFLVPIIYRTAQQINEPRPPEPIAPESSAQ